MAFRKKTYRRKRSFKRKNTVRKQIRRAKKAPLRRMIRAEIHKQVENKTVQCDPRLAGGGISSTYVTPGAPTMTALDARIIPLLPGHTNTASAIQPYVIPQGTGQGERVGNKITTRKLMFKGVITSEPYNVTTNPTPYPVYVKMVFFYNKELPSITPTPALDADLFQYGDTSQGFEGISSDVIRTFNTDKYRILAVRTFKIGYSVVAAAGTIAAQENFANNDFKISQPFRINLTKMCPKIIKFSDGGTLPSTRGLYCMLYSAPAFGSQITGISPSPQALCRWEITYEYEDA